MLTGLNVIDYLCHLCSPLLWVIAKEHDMNMRKFGNKITVNKIRNHEALAGCCKNVKHNGI